jgi:branched-chain amino acid aminotransferase
VSVPDEEARVAGSGTSINAAFGSVAAPVMAVAEATEGGFGPARVGPLAPFTLHPFAHALHYGSTCFEGLKAHRGPDGVVRLFRADRHVARMRRTAALLSLPVPDEDLLLGMIHDVTAANLADVPAAPGALYLRPMLFGTEPNIGAAASPSATATLAVVASPVGDYFAGGVRPLTLLLETELPRTTPQFGEVKAGANYAMALGITLHARRDLGCDQVLFAPGGVVQETGAANFLLIAEDRVVTPALDSSFLHGVTRDSVLTLARDRGLTVEERVLPVTELLAWSHEAALSGTAATLSGVGTLVRAGARHRVGTGEVGPSTLALRAGLMAVQRGEAEDVHGWTTVVTG